MEDAALAMRHAAEVQETKINEMGRERDVLLKLRHKAEGASSAQVPWANPASTRVCVCVCVCV